MFRTKRMKVRRWMKLILVPIIVVGGVAALLGYRWAPPDRPSVSTTASQTTGAQEARHERAREVGAEIAEVGAEIGDKVAAGASAAGRAIASGQLTAKIKAKMALDDTVSASAIDVDTNGTVVTLSGTVDSAGQRGRAVQLARETAGVTAVVDHLQVRPQ